MEHRFKDKPMTSFFGRGGRWGRAVVCIVVSLGLLAMVQVSLVMDWIPFDDAAMPPTLRGAESDPSYDVLGDILHLNNLNEACIHEKDAVISYAYNSSTLDPALVLHKDMDHTMLIQLLSHCPDVDVYLPSTLRDHGYCEDGMAYAKFLKTRVLPRWVFDIELKHKGRSMTYFDLCPQSAILFMNHYWDEIPDMATFPKTKKIVLMPNVEKAELDAHHYLRVNYVLAKTYDGYQRITSWYAREGNPRHTKVLYTQHVSSDPTLFARRSGGGHHGPTRDFTNLRFFHANDHSTEKNTVNLLKCWARRPDFPPLDIYSMDDQSRETFNALFKTTGAPENLRYHWGDDMDYTTLGKLMADSPVVLCPSSMEGFGHDINQARAAGALVATTDAPPMNELIDSASGVLIDNVLRPNPPTQLMGKGYKTFRDGESREGMEYDVEPGHICDAVDLILEMSPDARRTLALAGQERYFAQVQYFRTQMHALRKQLLFDLHGEM
ncbi:Aste57867_11098 [Aphanomyces stellatus]|uniref:Aste57867_11098 protein n=1 Tax=Aphanomyces stellatus TaxID=120398 RepID=A0A485KS26_9STRA|nr:hypothetical protein As57867_011056 [Aphanomyces stellatus]VFT87965.1 Aste57867_11098 [Aphanomyces stellatus]